METENRDKLARLVLQLASINSNGWQFDRFRSALNVVNEIERILNPALFAMGSRKPLSGPLVKLRDEIDTLAPLCYWRFDAGVGWNERLRRVIGRTPESSLGGIAAREILEDRPEPAIDPALSARLHALAVEIAKTDTAEPTAMDDEATLDERAVAIKVAHQEWTDQQVADAIGCHLKSLFKPNMVKYKQAKAALKAVRSDFIASGSHPDRQRRTKPISQDDDE